LGLSPSDGSVGVPFCMAVQYIPFSLVGHWALGSLSIVFFVEESIFLIVADHMYRNIKKVENPIVFYIFCWFYFMFRFLIINGIRRELTMK
jgi:hypothetical protein